MSDVVISDAPQIYQKNLITADAHKGKYGRDGKINDQKEATLAAKLYCARNVGEKCQEFLDYLEKFEYSFPQLRTKQPPQIIQGISWLSEDTLLYYPDGKIEGAISRENKLIQGVKCKAESVILFYEGGKLKRATLAEGKAFPEGKFRAGDEVVFDEDGKVVEVILAKPQNINGVYYGAGDSVYY